MKVNENLLKTTEKLQNIEDLQTTKNLNNIKKFKEYEKYEFNEYLIKKEKRSLYCNSQKLIKESINFNETANAIGEMIIGTCKKLQKLQKLQYLENINKIKDSLKELTKI